MEAKDITPEQASTLESYSNLMFSKLRSTIVQDLLNTKYENYIGKKYDVATVNNMLQSPTSTSNQKVLRQMSMYLYLVSSHYRRLINYYATLPTYNYFITPSKALDKELTKAQAKKYKNDYVSTINDFERYSLKEELPPMVTLALLEGIFCGIIFEETDSFYVKPCPVDYVKVQSIMDGCYRFAFDLSYFSGTNQYLLGAYGEDVYNAYIAYAGDKTLGIKGNSKLRWYEPEQQICIKYDSDPTIILPFFAGVFKEILDLEDYRLLAKAKTEVDNYKVLVMTQQTDSDGIPKMDYKLAKKYYDQAAANLPDGIGLILTPFPMSDFSFDNATVKDTDEVNQARDTLWASAGTSPLIFGSTEATSSSSLILSTKPDEEITFVLLSQLERNFNLLQKLKNRAYGFKIKFLRQSIYNKTDMQNSYAKAAQYGVTGSKLLYAASVDLSPCDVYGLAYLEDEVLGLTVTSFNKPMVSSYVQSGSADNEAGRPTNESKGLALTESGEADRDSDQSANAM